MPKVEDIKVLNIDNVPYAVDSMSDEVKQLVDVYNEWNRKQAEIRSELMMVQAALETVSRQIIAQVRKERAEAEADNTPQTDEGDGTPDPKPQQEDQ